MREAVLMLLIGCIIAVAIYTWVYVMMALDERWKHKRSPWKD